MGTKTAMVQLPSLPQVLVQIIDAIHSDKADYQHVAEIIRRDAGVAIKLISVANSSYYGREKRCESIERALLLLGTEVVKTVVITVSIKQFFSHFNQQHIQFMKQFWRRSLISANFAQVLATLTNYSLPDEAYLCGLLANVGQLMLLSSNEKDYLSLLEASINDASLLTAEQKEFAITHCQLGADLVDSWEISSFMADAVRYHHEPDHLILDAHHLVKIINLSSLLSDQSDINDQTLATANTLFGFNESLTRELCNRINKDVDKLAQTMGIEIADNATSSQRHQLAHRQLGARLEELGELAQLDSALGQAYSADGLQEAAQRSLFLTLGITESVLFLVDEQQKQLCSQPPTAINQQADARSLDFKIPLEPGRSLISDALLQGQPLSNSTTDRPMSVIDRQMLNYCRADILQCWPLISPAQDSGLTTKVGVLVFACGQQQLAQLKQRSNLTRNLCVQIAKAIVNNKQRLFDLEQQGPSAEHYQHQIREAIHEASNPLSIIRNYLEMLRIKLGDEHGASEGLELIKDEIDRVGNILLRLNDPKQAIAQTSVDINSIIEGLAQLFTDSICATRQLSLKLNLDSHLSDIKGNPEHLKQILTNLLKNAAEALEPKGIINVSSEASVSVNGREFIAINIKDDGPGIPEKINQKLFSPVSSTKGAGHSGLGLSIVKKLIEEMDGSIVCRSSTGNGTEFQILLPK